MISKRLDATPKSVREEAVGGVLSGVQGVIVLMEHGIRRSKNAGDDEAQKPVVESCWKTWFVGRCLRR